MGKNTTILEIDPQELWSQVQDFLDEEGFDTTRISIAHVVKDECEFRFVNGLPDEEKKRLEALTKGFVAGVRYVEKLTRENFSVHQLLACD